MRLIHSKAEYIPQDSGLNGVYKQIEICGRTCYKSLDKMTGEAVDAANFVGRMQKSGHTAMLEHGTVYLKVPAKPIEVSGELGIPIYPDPIDTLYYNPYSRYNIVDGFAYITTNYRVLIENKLLDALRYICEPTEHHEKRYTFRFITDRGVSHELVRHRVFSFAQESTRYCNYSKDKFGNELIFIKPSWNYTKTAVYANGVPQLDGDYFEEHLLEAERTYLELVEKFNWTPQQARQVLPNALKTEVCMTGFASDWKYLLDVRFGERTGTVSPDMKYLMSKLINEAEEANILNDIMKSIKMRKAQ